MLPFSLINEPGFTIQLNYLRYRILNLLIIGKMRIKKLRKVFIQTDEHT